MPSFVHFKDLDGQPVAIDRSRVALVRERNVDMGYGDMVHCTTIYLDGGEHVDVVPPIADVCRRLEERE